MPIALLGGPTGVGKTSIIDSLLKSDPRFVRPSAYTTRPRRPEDTQNQFTHVSQADMERLSLEGELLSLDEVHGHLYALSKNSIEELARENKIVIKEFYLRDHRAIQDLYVGALSAVIMPASAEAHAAHTKGNELINNRTMTRGASELSEHRKLLETHHADIVIYNNFRDSIEELSSLFSQEIFKAFI